MATIHTLIWIHRYQYLFTRDASPQCNNLWPVPQLLYFLTNMEPQGTTHRVALSPQTNCHGRRDTLCGKSLNSEVTFDLIPQKTWWNFIIVFFQMGRWTIWPRTFWWNVSTYSCMLWGQACWLISEYRKLLCDQCLQDLSRDVRQATAHQWCRSNASINWAFTIQTNQCTTRGAGHNRLTIN